jgi:dTDP-D-glucose 4,6-dehydratase
LDLQLQKHKVDLKQLFYNQKFYETYGLNDKRDKIIQNIKNCFHKKKIFKLYSKKLKLNFLHVEDVISALNILITKSIHSGEYLIKSKKHSYVYKLLDLLNKTNKKKINYKILNKKITTYDYKIKKLPKWNQKYFIENDFKKLITNENN